MRRYVKTIISGSIFVVLLLIVMISFFSIPVKNVVYDRVEGLIASSGHPSSCKFIDGGKILFKSWEGEEQINDYVITDRTIYIIKDNGSLSKIGRVVNGMKLELYLYDKYADEVSSYEYTHRYIGLITFISIVSVAFLIASLIELKNNNKQEPQQEKTEE